MTFSMTFSQTNYGGTSLPRLINAVDNANGVSSAIALTVLLYRPVS